MDMLCIKDAPFALPVAGIRQHHLHLVCSSILLGKSFDLLLVGVESLHSTDEQTLVMYILLLECHEMRLDM